MAIRRRTVHPDAVLYTENYGEVPFVSEQRLNEAVLAATEALSLAGGVLTVLVKRHPTDVDHEMVTSGAIIEWKDRTDARPQRETAEPVQARQPEPLADTAYDEPQVDVDEPDPDSAAFEEEQEDLSSIPVEAR